MIVLLRKQEPRVIKRNARCSGLLLSQEHKGVTEQRNIP